MDSATLLRRYGPAMMLVGTAGLLQAANKPLYDPAALADAERRLFGHLSMPVTHRFVQAGQHSLHTLIVGEGPPLVMLHGHGGGVGVWHEMIEPLAHHFRVYALDWLGWGRSERPLFRGTTPEAARGWWLNSLEDWRRALGLTDFYLLGHSLGGWLAAEYALAHPEHLRHLLLVNAAGLSENVVPYKGLFYLLSPQRMVQAAGRFGPRLVAHGVAAEAARCEHDSEALRRYYYHLSAAPLSGQIAFERLLTPRRWHFPLLPRATGLELPTTVIWGLHDDLFRIELAHRLMEHLPHGRLLTLPDARHCPHAEDGARFAEAIISVRHV